MVDQFKVPESGKPLTSLAAPVKAQAKALNGLRNLRFEWGDDWGFQWEEGGAVFQVPTYLVAAVADDDTPLTILDASDADHAGRIRIVNGTFANLPAAQMTTPDGVQPDGTDNSCYLTVSDGSNYVYGKVQIDGTSGLPTVCDVYVASSLETLSGTYLYQQIGIVTYDSSTGALSIVQSAAGNQGVLWGCSADGNTLYPAWNRQS